MVDLRILTFNRQGINKRLDVFDYLKNMNHDIYCLQGTHFTVDDEANIKSQWGNSCIFNHSRSNARGVAILFSKTLDYQIHKTVADDNGNFILILPYSIRDCLY